MIAYRVMNSGDIAAGLSLCRAAGWNQLAREWQLFLKSSPNGCFVAVDDNNHVSGTVTTLRYQDKFSWIGMVLVNPTIRRQGIGNGLLHQALDVLSNERTIKLDATPEGREVYLKLDFKDEYLISRMHVDGIVIDKLPNSTAVPLQKMDLDEVLKFDRNVFGANRTLMLNWLLDGAPELAFVVKEKDQVRGYCFGRYGHNFTQIGPIVATNVDHAINVTTAAMRNVGKRPVIIDVLHHTPEWVQSVINLGFVERRKLIRMYRGSNASPGTPTKQFAISGPEFG